MFRNSTVWIRRPFPRAKTLKASVSRADHPTLFPWTSYRGSTGSLLQKGTYSRWVASWIPCLKSFCRMTHSWWFSTSCCDMQWPFFRNTTLRFRKQGSATLSSTCCRPSNFLLGRINISCATYELLVCSWKTMTFSNFLQVEQRSRIRGSFCCPSCGRCLFAGLVVVDPHFSAQRGLVFSHEQEAVQVGPTECLQRGNPYYRTSLILLWRYFRGEGS